MSRHSTPLRYPGGKQKLAPFFRELIDRNELGGCQYSEPFAGGAGVAIDLLLAGKVSHIHLNDSCPLLYAFWRSILTKTDKFCTWISKASLTVDEWKRQREIVRHASSYNQLEVGFSLFYLNRCNRSGIPTGGLIGGLDQSGPWKMDARFPRSELIRRIESIAVKKKQITIKNMDAEDFLTSYVCSLPAPNLVYCDPPYFHKADRLYTNHYKPDDHLRISELIQSGLDCKWVVSYDATQTVINHYNSKRSMLYELQYNASNAYKGREVMFFSDDLNLPSTSAFKPVDLALPDVRRRRTIPVRSNG